MARKKKTAEEREYDVLLANMRELLKTRQGKDFIWHILSITNLYTENFTGNSTTFYNEGRRAVGLQVLHLLDEADPTAYARLILENQKREESKHGNDSDTDGSDTDTDSGSGYDSDD